LFEQVNTTTTTGSLKAHNSLIQGTVNACLNLGAVIGCLSCMFVGNRLGRRKTVVIGAAIEIVGTILFASAFAYAQLIIGRRTYRPSRLCHCAVPALQLTRPVLLGIGLGMMSATLPTWQAETSRTHKRGHHVIIDGIAVSCNRRCPRIGLFLTFTCWRAITPSLLL
jgi:MFS family permease